MAAAKVRKKLVLKQWVVLVDKYMGRVSAQFPFNKNKKVEIWEIEMDGKHIVKVVV